METVPWNLCLPCYLRLRRTLTRSSCSDCLDPATLADPRRSRSRSVETCRSVSRRLALAELTTLLHTQRELRAAVRASPEHREPWTRPFFSPEDELPDRTSDSAPSHRVFSRSAHREGTARAPHAPSTTRRRRSLALLGRAFVAVAGASCAMLRTSPGVSLFARAFGACESTVLQRFRAVLAPDDLHPPEGTTS